VVTSTTEYEYDTISTVYGHAVHAVQTRCFFPKDNRQPTSGTREAGLTSTIKYTSDNK